MENEDVIRHQMEETRTSLTEKIETLEEKLATTVQETKDAITDTVQETKTAITDTVSTVKESVHEGVETVKDWMDVKAHVQERPWLMLGGSILAGFALGNLLGERREAPRPRRGAPATPARSSYGNGGMREKAQPQEESKTAEWLHRFDPEIAKLKGLALGATFGTIREMLAAELPPEIGRQVREIIDGVTEKLGGEPLPDLDLGSVCATSSSNPPQASRRQPGDGSAMGSQAGMPTKPTHSERFSMG